MKLLLPLILLLTGIACVGAACDASAHSSVTVSVYDGAGDLYEPDRVTYSVDGEPEQDCEDLGDGSEFVCGWEQVGSFLITVYDGGATFTAEAQVDQGSDGCHVDSAFVDITVS